MATLTRLKEYPNIDVLIETAVMKQNIDNIASVRHLVKEHFPKYEHKGYYSQPVPRRRFYAFFA